MALVCFPTAFRRFQRIDCLDWRIVQNPGKFKVFFLILSAFPEVSADINSPNRTPRYWQQRKPLNNGTTRLVNELLDSACRICTFACRRKLTPRQEYMGIINESLCRQRSTPLSAWTPPSQGGAVRDMEEEDSGKGLALVRDDISIS